VIVKECKSSIEIW